MSEANEAGDGSAASEIIKKLMGTKEEREESVNYRTHIRELIANDFFYCVLTSDGCSLSLTGNGKDAEAWRTFALQWHKEVLSKRSTPNEEERYEGSGKTMSDGYA